VADAESLVLARMPHAPAVHAPLADCVGRVLAEDVTAERDQPPFDRVTMDGIAVAYAELRDGTRRFAVAGTQAAGAPPMRRGPGECIEVMTGAMLPAGCDTVVPVE